MSPDEIKALRRATGLSQKELASALSVEIALVREWEKGDHFPTRGHCEAMEALRANPPPRKKKSADRSPMELLGDPGFFTLVRKLLTHAPLRVAVEALAEDYADPNEPGTEPPRSP
ncbi:MAG: helix-turn-helix domain-containing protein [Deltaproteobacteria bacterium]